MRIKIARARVPWVHVYVRTYHIVPGNDGRTDCGVRVDGSKTGTAVTMREELSVNRAFLTVESMHRTTQRTKSARG